MASSSTSSFHRSYQYDVFLSFRGEDTRKNFVDHLYDALERQGVHTFKDDERLNKGKTINDELLNSIEDSKFCIIVFSKNYASSSWCLDELVKIMECHKTTDQTVYPVFYDVDPSEVRKQSGAVGEALAKLKNEEVGKWRKVLEEAANMSGWDLRKTRDGHEAKVIKLIVERLSLELRTINPNVDENLIGMEQRMQDLESYLEIGVNDVRMIGIRGMGGAGKTTLARAIYEKVSFHFEGLSFVENVREASKASGLPPLQKQVLCNVLKDQGGIIVDSVHDGKNMMHMRLPHKKVLLVLDDVDHKDQLEALAGELNWFKKGSRIIITTRDEQVLISHKVKFIHDVNLLSEGEAIRFFSRHAFGRDIPIKEYETQSLEVVHYAAGLPLTIKVLGSFLCGKDKPEWVDALERLKTIPLKETLEKLELSYESLEDDYKEIFLDVVCFMKRWDKDKAIGVLERCGFHAVNGLRVLEQRSLITMNELYGIIDMHDHIEEMGKNIVRRVYPDEPHKHSRLWIQDEIEEVLADDLGTEATRCLHMKLTPEIVVEGLGNMKRLRYLLVNYKNRYDTFSGHVTFDEVSQYFPNSLRYLFWIDYPHWCLPKTFRANNLVALEMPCSRIEQLWQRGERKIMKKLKALELPSSRKLRILDLGLTPNLEGLDLKGCSHLEELHVPVGCLKRLVYLNLHSCKSLKSLSFIKQLESLEILNLGDLSLSEFPDIIIPGHSNDTLLEFNFSQNDIEELPSSVGNFHKLVYLCLYSCRKLKSLPLSLFSLQHLRVLSLESCGIEELPEDLGRLVSLTKLNLKYTQLKRLPDSICRLKHLKTLLLECSNLDKLPEDLGQLESLEKLDLSYCDITDIPNSICMLKRLRKLDLDCCNQLQKLPDKIGDLERLTRLRVGNTLVKYLPDSMCILKLLKDLYLRDSDIDKLPEDLGQLESLEALDLSSCHISEIPSSICMLKRLKWLNLGNCKQLQKLPGKLENLESLEELNVRGSGISHLPDRLSLLSEMFLH